jgi:hypothetical protein
MFLTSMKLLVVALVLLPDHKDTSSCDETASPHVVTDVLISYLACYAGNTKPRQVVNKPAGAAVMFACSLEQIELFSPMNGRTAVVHPELGVHLIGVRPHGVQGHHERTGNLRAAQVGPELPEHVKLTHAQWLDQRHGDRETGRQGDLTLCKHALLYVSLSPCLG